MPAWAQTVATSRIVQLPFGFWAMRSSRVKAGRRRQVCQVARNTSFRCLPQRLPGVFQVSPDGMAHRITPNRLAPRRIIRRHVRPDAPAMGGTRSLSFPDAAAGAGFFDCRRYVLHHSGASAFRSRTPGPPPFCSMNTTPAASRAVRMASTVRR